MKHKAQEALDCLYDENKMDKFAKGFSRDDDYTSQFDYDNAKDYCIDKLNELIKLQIPYKYLQMLCIVVKENIDRLEKKARKFEREGKFSDLAVYSGLIEQHKQIIEVLHKQKEMWEEEECQKQ
ncbi:hypothetical protein ACWG0P_07200 [Amedibacillus sp. YH-ame6]